ncbi:hypothetical protein [Crossiella sp. CA198]|uniref:hypothetical protein n=1 Tax=Crossiella sp. CA198 TaxID=3455607 RepID=UPI003F8D4310
MHRNVHNQATNSQNVVMAGAIHDGVHFYQGYLDRRTSRMAIGALVFGLCGFLPVFVPIALTFAIIVLTRLARLGNSTGDQSGSTAFSPPHPETQPPTAHQPGGSPGSTPGSTHPGGPSIAAPGSTNPAAPPIPAPGTTHSGRPATPVQFNQPTPPQPNPAPAPFPSSPAGTHPADLSAPIAGPPGMPAGVPGPVAGFGTGVTAATGAAGAAAGLVGMVAASKTIALAMALLGLLFSLVWGGVWTAGIIHVTSTADGCVTPPAGHANACTLKPGDCLIRPSLSTETVSVRLTSCTEPHDAQAFGAYSGGSGPWPGWNGFLAGTKANCPAIAQRNVNLAALTESDQIGYLAPNEVSWNEGYRNVICMAYHSAGSWTSSILQPGADLSLPTR